MFAELLGRSCFSFLRGASHPEEMVSRAQELGLHSLALCDRDGLYGSVRALTRARDIGQRVIVGAELSLAAVPASSGGRAFEPAVVALLVENHTGYSNLCRLLTRSHAGKPKGESALDVAWLSEHAEGLVAIVPAYDTPDTKVPSELCEVVRDAFGERGFLAIFRRFDAFDRDRMESTCERARRYGLPILASARPFYHHRSRKPLADVVHCIRERTTLDRAGSALSANAEAYLRSEAQMKRLFADHPEWLGRTAEVASGLGFRLSELNYRFPCQLLPGETADSKLRRLSEEGALRRYPEGVPKSIRAQIDKELLIIEKLLIAPYFLSTWEIVEIAREKRILCQGRGSAANSAVCFVLGITAVDPARSNLLFERFISAERAEPPDIDIDFEHERREEVIQEIYARYGRERAAMVSEVICYRGKSALREVGKVFGLSLEQVDRLSGTITHWDTAEASHTRLTDFGFDIGDSRVQKVIALAEKLQGFPRHLSIHVGGFVLSADPLHEVAPIEPARMEDRTVVPWDKDDLEELGFFKVDVLALGMLTAVRKCLALMHASGGVDAGGLSKTRPESDSDSFDPLEAIVRIPPEDPAAYAMISRADTVGVFQIESRAQMAMLPRLRPQRFYDLVIEVAIVRPGPIQGGMVHPYLKRRASREEVTVPHPDLWPILERTLGVPLFQEQVMQIAITGAGYTGGEADQLRRDMAAWKRSGKLMRHRQRLLDGFAAKGIARDFGEALFEQIKGFGDYGFPESHAASFALLVYASAWQKAHFPAHFACALINSQPMGFYTPSTIIQDAQRHGVEVRDVCVVASEWDCTLEEASEVSSVHSKYPAARRALRLGLRVVKGLREAAARRIVAARAERPFTDLEDLLRRSALNKDDTDRLAEAGAFERLVSGRRQALWQARSPRVGGLFADVQVHEPAVRLPPLRSSQQLLLDYAKKGLSVADHPMRHVREALRQRGALDSAELQRAPQGQRVSVAGLVICRQQPGTASGIVFITLEDELGFCNLVLYRDVYEKFHRAARHSTILLAHGDVERHVPDLSADTPIVHLIARQLERLDLPGQTIASMSRDFH
ncbi:MAG TPA: error-prone DNA polymerase [Polyangiaceae bacterium]